MHRSCERSDHALGSIGERSRGPAAERGRHVPSHEPPLADRVLGGGRTRLTAPEGVWDRRAVADRPNVTEAHAGALVPGHRGGQAARVNGHGLVDDHPSLAVQREAQPGNDGTRLDPGCPYDRPRRDRLVVGELGAVCGDAAQRCPRAHLNPPPAQLAFCELRERGGHLLHAPWPGLCQHPAHSLRPAARIELDHLRREVLQLGQPLHARIARTHEHEPEVLRAQRGVLE